MKIIKNIRKPNQLRAIWAMTKISLLASLRNPASIFFSFFFPFIFIVVFGLLGQGTQSYQLGISPGSVKSGPFYEALQKVDVLKLITDKDDVSLNDQISKGQIPAVADIQADGEIQVAPNTKITKYKLKLRTSAADPQNASTVSIILDNVVDSFNAPQIANAVKLIDVSKSVVEGRKYTQIDFILPGQLAFALLTNALFGISIAFVSMREKLITKRIFAAPVNKWNILVSEVLAKFIIAILQALLIILVGHFAFNFTLANGGSTLIAMLVLSLVGIFTFLSLGLLVASIGKTEDTVSPLANLIMMPQLFLSGAFFSIELFPAFLQPIAKVLPMTFLNEAFRKVAFEGADLSTTLPQIAGLLVWAAIIYAVDVKLFKWE